jgi:amidase
VDNTVAAGVRKAAQLLSAAGYAVEEVDPPAIAEAAEFFMQLLVADIRAMFLPVMKEMATPGSGSLAFLNHLFAVTPEPTLSSYIHALAQRNRIARAWTQFALNYPLILGPVATIQPFPIGYDIAGQAQVQDLLHSMRLTISVNFLGLPSVAVPVGLADGLPQGVQIIGPRYREDLCLEAAEAIERQAGVLTPIDPKG